MIAPILIPQDAAQITSELIAHYEQLTNRTLYPAHIERLLIDTYAYREMLLRMQMQDALLLNLVEFSRAPMLDHLAANVGVTRLPDESDDELRKRIPLSFNKMSTAGSIGSYAYHARSAVAGIVDVAVVSHQPGVVTLYPLLRTGLPDADTKAAVLAKCSADDVRPLTDTVLVNDPSIIHYEIVANVLLYNGATSTDVLNKITSIANAYATSKQQRLGRDIVIDELIAALRIDCVYAVGLTSPSLNIELEPWQLPVCDNISINFVGFKAG